MNICYNKVINKSKGDDMNSVNKTLFIPLYGKSYVSKKGLFLADKKAEEIWEAEGFALKGKSKSKWLAYYMGIRSAVFDEWVKKQMAGTPEGVVLHIGCGMDSRVVRVGQKAYPWYDVDFAKVIKERKRYYSETAHYQMLAGDVREEEWLTKIPECNFAIVVMEGVNMYLTNEEMRGLMDRLCAHFEKLVLLVDCYTPLAAKMSKYKNPINDVGVTKVYGVENPQDLQSAELIYVGEDSMTPQKYVDELQGMEKFIFSKLYAGSFAKKLYRLFEYKKS